MRIKYPSIEEVIEANKRVLSIYRAKKGDKHELLGTKSKIQDVIDKTKRKRGDIYQKSAVLLQELTKSHIFASGNRRTAYFITTSFIHRNAKYILSKEDIKENLEIFKKIRYNQISEEELIKWLKSK